MRTNTVPDAALVERAKELTGIKTTRAVVERALCQRSQPVGNLYEILGFT